MARIEQVEILMVDLQPKVGAHRRHPVVRQRRRRRSCASATPTARSASATPTRSAPAATSVLALLARSPGAAADRARCRHDRSDLEGSAVLHPRHHGRRDHLAGAGGDRHGAVGPALPAQRTAAAQGWRAARRSACRLYTTEGGWLHLETEALVDDALRAQGAGLRRLQDQGRPAARTEDVARLAAVREAVGRGFEIMTDANQAFTVDEAIRRAAAVRAARHRLVRGTAAGRRHRRPRTAVAVHPTSDRGRRDRSMRSAISANTCSAGACSIVQVDVGAHRRHHAVAQGRASGRGVQRGGLPAFPDGTARVA